MKKPGINASGRVACRVRSPGGWEVEAAAELGTEIAESVARSLTRTIARELRPAVEVLRLAEGKSPKPRRPRKKGAASRVR